MQSRTEREVHGPHKEKGDGLEPENVEGRPSVQTVSQAPASLPLPAPLWSSLLGTLAKQRGSAGVTGSARLRWKARFIQDSPGLGRGWGGGGGSRNFACFPVFGKSMGD